MIHQLWRVFSPYITNVTFPFTKMLLSYDTLPLSLYISYHDGTRETPIVLCMQSRILNHFAVFSGDRKDLQYNNCMSETRYGFSNYKNASETRKKNVSSYVKQYVGFVCSILALTITSALFGGTCIK